jgi:hypothetical protein
MPPVPPGGHPASDSMKTGHVLVYVNDECGFTMPVGRGLHSSTFQLNLSRF